MKLETYLESVKNCPDDFIEHNGRLIHKLTAEYGVYDNWPIFLYGNFESFVNYLTLGHYTKHKDLFSSDSHRKKYSFFYNPGTVQLLVMDYIPLGEATGSGDSDMAGEVKEHFENQKENFNIGIMIHPYQENEIERVNEIRALAIVIDEIGRYSQKNNMKLCFPHSMGWNHQSDYSRIVYYP